MLTLLPAAAVPAAAQKGEGEKPSPWDLDKIPAGKRYPTTAAAHNVNCKGAHDFELSFEGDAAALFTFKDTNIVRGVGPGATKSVDVYLDARTAAPGVYNGGAIVQKCLTCPPKCQPHVQRREIHLTLTGEAQDGGPKVGIPGGGAPGSGSGTGGGPVPGGGGATTGGGGGTKTGGSGPGTTATGGGGGGPTSAPPRDDSQPVRRCGGDVTEAFAEILQRAAARLGKLPSGERWEGNRRATFKRRNPIVLLPAELDAAAGCPLSGECAKTVTFYGRCVPYLVPEEVLRGFVDRLLGEPNATGVRTQQEAEQEEKASEQERRSSSAHWLGVKLGGLYFANYSFSRDRSRDPKDNDAVGEPDEFVRVAAFHTFGEKADPLAGRFAACPICTTKLGFAADWSKETWTLSDGSRVEPP